MTKPWIVRLAGFPRVSAALMLPLLALWIGGCNANITERDLDKHTVSVAEVRRLIDVGQRKNRDDVILLVDPRPSTDFEKGHLPGARNIQLSAIKPKDPIDKSIDRYKNIIVYGYDPASASARGMAKRLMGLGYDNVSFYSGGVYQWSATGGELVTSEPKTQVGNASTPTPTGQ